MSHNDVENMQSMFWDDLNEDLKNPEFLKEFLTVMEVIRYYDALYNDEITRGK